VIGNDYGEMKGASLQHRADLFLFLERLARAAVVEGQDEVARQCRALIALPVKYGQEMRRDFDAAARRRIEELESDPSVIAAEVPSHDSTDLAQLLRQILADVPTGG